MKPTSSILSRTIRIELGILMMLVVPAIAGAQVRPDPIPEVTITETPAKTKKISDLTARYRFSERYTNDFEHTAPGLVSSSRIGINEVVKESIESSKGAPKRSEFSRETIFNERPVEINGIGNVTSVVRTFEKYTVKPPEPSGLVVAPLEGLSLLIRPRLADLPQVLTLNDGRSLSESEYDAVAHQIFLPQMSGLLPTQVVRMGETWKISRRGTQALLADPVIIGDGLTGKLAEIRKEVDGPRYVAAIEVSGKVATAAGDCNVNAELLFTFLADSSLKGFSTKPTFPPRPTEDITESRGSLTQIRLARVTTGPLPGPGRLRYQLNREMTMHRHVGLLEGSPPPVKLKEIPELTDANSWLTFADPGFRYTFQHPQDLLFPERNLASPEPKASFMIRSTRDARDMLQIEFVPRMLTPEDLKAEMAEKYKLMKMEVIKGEELQLPEKEWPTSMRVLRIDSEVKLVDPKAASVGSARIHFDGYLIQFGQRASIIAISSTTRNSVAPYRNEIEKILKTIRLDPPRPPTAR